MSKKIINKNSFGKRLREYRNELGLTQSELAEKINVSQNFLGDLERGVKLPSLEKLILLANTLKVSLDYLFADSLDNVLNEDEETYYSDKQMAIIKNIVKSITSNF